MSLSTFFGIAVAVAFVSAILFVIFGQVTVRKLRKNPETKQALGIEFASGWDILNVAQALALPKTITRRLKRNSISMGMGQGFEADPDVLYKHTTVFDRVLARVFYTLFALSGIAIILLTMFEFFWGYD